jgi:hypothetical protein
MQTRNKSLNNLNVVEPSQSSQAKRSKSVSEISDAAAIIILFERGLSGLRSRDRS